MMNIEKTIAKREEKMNKSRIAKTYKVMGITVRAWWCVPLVPIVVTVAKIGRWWKNRDTWNNKKADRIIIATLAKSADLEEDGTISYPLRSWGQWWDSTCKWYDRPFANKYRHEIHNYFKEEFTLNGYTKAVEPDKWDNDWCYVTFKKN